jgi:hypothetical protein
MRYSMDLYDNLTVFKPLGHELHTKMNTNALKPVLLTLVYSYFLSFVASIHQIKKQKSTNLF